MRISKAVITAAGRNQRTLPLQRLVDRDGTPKTVLRIVVEEALSAGIDEVCVVICPGDETAYREAAGNLAARLYFIEQHDPLGYGHAIVCAHPFTGNDPFLHLVGDHLWVSRVARSCAQQLVDLAESESCAVSAVQPSRESQLPYYGVVGGRLVRGHRDIYLVERVVEKPTPTEAEQHLMVPGLRVGHYLCFFGMHVLTPMVMEILEKRVRDNHGRGSIQLSDALNELSGSERYLALANLGARYDVGGAYGLLNAQLALALDGADRDEVLAMLVELLASRAGRGR